MNKERKERGKQNGRERGKREEEKEERRRKKRGKNTELSLFKYEIISSKRRRRRRISITAGEESEANVTCGFTAKNKTSSRSLKKIID